MTVSSILPLVSFPPSFHLAYHFVFANSNKLTIQMEDPCKIWLKVSWEPIKLVALNDIIESAIDPLKKYYLYHFFKLWSYTVSILWTGSSFIEGGVVFVGPEFSLLNYGADYSISACCFLIWSIWVPPSFSQLSSASNSISWSLFAFNYRRGVNGHLRPFKDVFY